MTQFKVALGNKVPAGVSIDALEMVASDHKEAFRTIWNASPALRYIVDYGWKQTLNDAIAAIKLTDSDYSIANTRAVVNKKIDAILDGTVKAGRTVSRTADPVAREAKSIASAMFAKKSAEVRKTAIAAWIAAKGGNEKEAKAAILALIASQEAVLAMARENVAKVAAVPQFDLATLMGESEEESNDEEESDDESDDEDESDESDDE